MDGKKVFRNHNKKIKPIILLALIQLIVSQCNISTSERNIASNQNPAVMPTKPGAFPTTVPYKKGEIKKLFGVLDYEQDPDSSLHFGVLMPLRWGQVKGTRHLITPERPFALRAHIKSLEGPEADIKVYIAYTADEVDPNDWLTIHLANLDEKILHQVLLPREGGTVPDVLTVSGPRSEERISRWLVLKTSSKEGGAHLFIVQASVAANHYSQEMANVFFMAVNNFVLYHPQKWPYAEQLRTLIRDAPVKIYSAFPLSWEQSENPVSDPKRFYQVKLTKDRNGRRIGSVDLSVYAGMDLQTLHHVDEEIRLLSAKVEHTEFTSPKFTPAPVSGDFQEVYTAASIQRNAPEGTVPQERHVWLGRAGAYWVRLENLRYAQSAAPYEWAVSKRAFDIVQQHLAINP